MPEEILRGWLVNFERVYIYTASCIKMYCIPVRDEIRKEVMPAESKISQDASSMTKVV